MLVGTDNGFLKTRDLVQDIADVFLGKPKAPFGKIKNAANLETREQQIRYAVVVGRCRRSQTDSSDSVADSGDGLPTPSHDAPSTASADEFGAAQVPIEIPDEVIARSWPSSGQPYHWESESERRRFCCGEIFVCVFLCIVGRRRIGCSWHQGLWQGSLDPIKTGRRSHCGIMYNTSRLATRGAMLR